MNRVFRSLGKTLLKMKKHELHKILERADEVAILLQHKIAKNSDLLLQLSQRQDPSPHQDDLADIVQTGQTDMMEFSPTELLLEM